MIQPNHTIYDINQSQLSVYEWHKEYEGEQPTLVFVHATGFHARCWDEMIEMFPKHHVIAIDQRGHGLSSNCYFNDWMAFVNDIIDLLSHLKLKQVVGIGHSMGGHCLAMASAQETSLFSKLFLIDPVILSDKIYQKNIGANIGSIEDHPIARRRNEFTSVEDAIKRYKNRPPYCFFTTKSLHNYFEFGLVPTAGDSSYTLACPPAVEAKIYLTVFSNPKIIEAINTINIPVIVFRGMQAESVEQMMSDFRYSPTYQGLAGLFSNGKDIYLKDLTHFMPMQAPKTIVKLITDHL